MCARFSVVHIQDYDRYYDWETNKHHGEEDVFAEEGESKGGRWDDFRDEEEKHCLREEDVDAEGDLFTGIRGKIEN